MSPAARMSETLLLLICSFALAGCGSGLTGTGSGLGIPSPQPGSSTYWSQPAAGSSGELGAVRLPGSPTGVGPALQLKLTAESGHLICKSASWSGDGSVLSLTYLQGDTPVHVSVHITPIETGFQAEIDADQPLITSVDIGSWSQSLETRAIPVPYYSGKIYYSAALNEFVNAWWDWRSTASTTLKDTSAQYKPKTDGKLNLLHERLTVAASASINDLFPLPGTPPSPHRGTLSGRTILDIWNGTFHNIEQSFSDLGDYGIGNCAGIIHVWQSAGYDNALPEHYPANQDLGGPDELKAALDAGASSQCLMALHENYVDYYPDFPQFTPASIALKSDSTYQTSWFNSHTGVQSLATKPDWMLKNANAQSPQIHALYGTTASYVDVNSAVAPSWRADMDARQPSAGMMTAMWTNDISLWQFERQTHNGPVFGEGAAHWYYSGLLDGVEAETATSLVKRNSGESIPLFVDFDLSRIHPLQVNHGMGYYERWTTTGNTNMSFEELDAYRTQEIAFGHAPFLGGGLWNAVPFAILESGLVGPVAAQYGLAQANAIRYLTEGAWKTASAAAPAGEFTQLKAQYDNGLTVVANSNPRPLQWNGLILPQFGWAAMSPDLIAYTALCGKTVCDYSETATTFFANSRNQSDWRRGWGLAKPAIAEFSNKGSRSFQISYEWEVYRGLDPSITYKVFVHFVNDDDVSNSHEGIVFQDDHYPQPRTTDWKPEEHVSETLRSVEIPPTVPDGTYSIRIGLFDPATGERMLLSGDNDAKGRYLVGTLTVAADGTKVTVTPTAAPGDDARLNANGSVVDFGAIQTDGMVSIVQKDGEWVLRPFPRYRNFTVSLSSKRFPMPQVVQTIGGAGGTVQPVADGEFWKLPLNGSKAYSWSVQ